MKTITTITLFILASALAFGQQYTLETYQETTNKGIKQGMAAGWVFTVDNYGYQPYKITLGGFYQHAVLTSQTSEQRLMMEKVFTGMYVESQLMNHKKFDLWFNARVGLQNGENFLITPMMKAKYALVKNLELTAGVGARGFKNPTLAYGASFSF